MFLDPAVAGWCLDSGWDVSLVVEPAKPFCWHHTGIIVNTMLGVVNDPSITSIEIFIILVVFVSVFVFSNQSSILN